MTKTIVTAALVAMFAISSANAAVCVRYNVLGDTGCQDRDEQPEPEAPAEPAIPAPTAPVMPEIPAPQAPNLEDRVQQYLDDYGKPPREYIRFMLEPTLENAMLWAQKFRQMQNRSSELADAWRQAEDIMEQREAKGLALPMVEQLPEVPDFEGTPVSDPTFQTWGVIPEAEPEPMDDFHRVDDSAISRKVVPLDGGRIGGTPAPDVTAESTVQMSYYFSAECPFCQRFEPGFQAMLTQLGDGVDVTCVDLTPSGARAENIAGKVDCTWRPVVGGEMQAFGIRSTPTLLINKGGKLTKVEGLVDLGKLYGFLTQ